MTAPVAIFTSDHRHDVLRVMLYLYSKHWNWPATVYGFAEPKFDLPDQVKFVSLGDMADYPVNKWSDAALKALGCINESIFILLLEDYWLTRDVDMAAIELACTFMRIHDDIARFDLTSDRLYAGNLKEVRPFGRLDIITNDPPQQYAMSLQAGIFNKELFKKFVIPGETPWEVELNGTTRLTDAYAKGDPGRVVGTRQNPVRYLIAVQNGKLTLDGGYQTPAPVMRQEDRQAAMELLHNPTKNVDIAFAGVAK